MAKQDAHLLVGLPHAGLPVLTAALEQHRDALADRGVRVPARSADEAFRAAVEVRREHKAWGVRRKDVEGTWAGICRRALKRKDTVVVGHELFAGAAPDEIDLLVDGLAGCRVHVVVVVDAPDPLVGLVPSELDFSDVVTRWERAAKAPERVHVLVGGPAAAWQELGRLVGFDAEALPLPAHEADAGRLDVRTLSLLAESTAALLDGDELEELVEHWAKVAADGGVRRTRGPGGSRSAGRRHRRTARGPALGPGRDRGRGRPAAREGGGAQCGCQASSSAVREVTAFGSRASASCWMETCSNTSRSERRAAIQTCWSTAAVSLYSTDSGRRP